MNSSKITQKVAHDNIYIKAFSVFIYLTSSKIMFCHLFFSFTFESRYNSQYTSFITIFFLTSVHLTKKENNTQLQT